MINYNAALPALPLMANGAINVNAWMGGIKGSLTSLIRSMFAKGEQGFALDPNDLDEAKLKWRRNLLTETEFRNGIVDVTYRGSGVTASSFNGVATGTGFAVPSGAFNPAYKVVTNTVAGKEYTFSFFVRMDDGGVPVVDNAGGDPTSDFSMIMSGYVTTFMQTRLIPYGNGLYRVIGTRAADGVGQYFGLVKSNGNSARTFTVSGYQLELGTSATTYQPITDFNSEFLKAFPLHTLFQDTSGKTPVTSAGQPVSLVLDKSRGLSTSAEMLINGDFTTANGWVIPTGGLTVADGKLKADSTTNHQTNRFDLPAIAGKWYKLTVSVSSHTRGSPRVSIGGSLVDIAATVGTRTYYVRAINTTQLVYVYAGYYESGGVWDIDSISVKEMYGNHAYQTTSASRPLFRQTPILGNELVVNGTFDTNTVGWGGWLCTVSRGEGTGILTTTSAGNPQVSQSAVAFAGKTVQVSAKVKKRTGGTNAKLVLYSSATGDIGTAVSTSVTGSELRFIVTVPVGFSGFLIWMLNNATIGDSLEVDDVSVKEILGYHTDQNYLEFDGIDDFLVTNNIDFTMTDKISLFAGVRKLSDVQTALVVESSVKVDLNAGAFNLAAPSSIGLNKFSSDLSYGTTYLRAENTETKYSAPISAVLTSHLQRTATLKSVKLRINSVLGAQVQQAPNGSGMGNYPLFIGRRGGVELPFTGNIYSLIGIGRLTTDAETLALEKAIAKQTGVTLNV